MFWYFSDVKAQSSKVMNYRYYSKELKKQWKKSIALLTNNHKDKKEIGIVDGFRNVASLHPEEEGICNLLIADFYKNRSNYPDYDSAVYYYIKADGNIPDSMLYEKILVYDNLFLHFVSEENFERAERYALLSAEIDSASYGNMARLCLFGGPEYFNPILAIDYCHIALRNGTKEDLFPLIYAAQYIVNTIDDNTFDSVSNEYLSKVFIKMAKAATINQATEYLEKAAARNYFPAINDLATFMATKKIYTDKDYTEMCQRAITLLKPLVEANYPPALHATGMAIEYSNLMLGGILVKPSGFKQAYPYFEKGCELGYPPSIAEVGRYHELNLGRLFGQHPEEAVKYYNTAESEGYYQAKNLKADMRARGQFREARTELMFATVSLVKQINRTKTKFKSNEFQKKYDSKSVHKKHSNVVNTSSTDNSNNTSNKDKYIGRISAFGLSKFAGSTVTHKQSFEVWQDNHGYYIMDRHVYGQVKGYLIRNTHDKYFDCNVSNFNYSGTSSGINWFFKL